jgi:O-antigen/teichoic acid export membrane protein
MTPFLWRILPLIVLGTALCSLGTALCSLANILLTRNMSAAEYGSFSFFLSTISLMSLIGLLGFQQTLPHFLSLYTRERRPALIFGS